jgi:O-antigen/teichoic acid export membrane protein
LSRVRRAGISATFGYLQFAIAIASGVILVPYTLRMVGTASYGLWLGYAELIGYSALVDLGVLGVLPWLIAESDGQRDTEEIRRLLAAGLVVSTITAICVGIVSVLLLVFGRSITNVNAQQWALVAAPMLLLVVGNALSYPLRTFSALLHGLQDVTFMGWTTITILVVDIALTVLLLRAGYGLYALAIVAITPALLGPLLSLIRVRVKYPHLLRDWSVPPLDRLRALAGQGFGAWTSSFGWRLIAASNTVVILRIAGPELAVVYACTAKVGEALMQLSWQLSDSGMVGLAQLKGEGNNRRVQEIVIAMMRVTLLGAGAVACGVIAFNPSFVTFWVGGSKFGGLLLNCLLAAGVIGLSLAHALFAPAATLGKRIQVGWGTAAQGVTHVTASLVLGYLFGIRGVAAAAPLASVLVAYPIGVRLLCETTGMSTAEIWRRAVAPWAIRSLVLATLAIIVGMVLPRGLLWVLLVSFPPALLLYFWWMRALYDGIPLPARVRGLLSRMKLVPE